MKRTAILAISLALATPTASAHDDDPSPQLFQDLFEKIQVPTSRLLGSRHEESGEALWESGEFESTSSWKKATDAQIAEVNRGKLLKEDFLSKCARETPNSPWCDQLTRPNPSSISVFRCTHGNKQAHQLINPSRAT